MIQANDRPKCGHGDCGNPALVVLHVAVQEPDGEGWVRIQGCSEHVEGVVQGLRAMHAYCETHHNEEGRPQ